MDEVAPEHVAVHRLLMRWGLWNLSRSPSSGLASIEGLYTKGDVPPATAPISADPEVMAVEVAVIRLVNNAVTKDHGRFVRLLYVRRLHPATICRALWIRWLDFPRWAYTSREMVRCAVVAGRYGT